MNNISPETEVRSKRRIYMNEYNLVHDNAAYLPLVSGSLHAYAREIPAIRDGYEFAPYLFMADFPENILAKYDAPDVAAFSLYSWSANLSLRIAQEIKERYPQCLIIFGGGSVPHDPTEFLQDHPFVDICVRGEGELPFGDILVRNLSSGDFSDIPQVSWRDGDAIKINDGEYPFERDLDSMPSSYVGGLFDRIIDENPQFSFQAILETNRGCPFKCTFCYWGKGDIGRRFKFHSLERAKQEIDWMGKNKIGYVFSADSNFGMHRRDIELAQALAETKDHYGYPQRFRACYGKNTDSNIYDTGKVLFDHGLDKGVNLSRQSNDKDVLVNIKRGNIKMDTYRSLQTKFAQSGIPTWTEMIVGLPGETYDSFVAGVEDVLNSKLKSLFLYWLEAFPNTDMGDPKYQAQFGMKLRKSDIKPIHCAVNNDGKVMESTQIVTETASMPYDQWRRTWKFSWSMMALQSLGASNFILHFLRRHLDIPFTDFVRFLVDEAPEILPTSLVAEEMSYYDKRLDDIYNGAGWGVENADYGDIYWFTEDGTFFRFAAKKDRFFRELEELLGAFLNGKGITIDPVLLSEVVRYQWLRLPGADAPPVQQWQFQYNIPEYMERVVTDDPAAISSESQVLYIDPTDYEGNLNRFALEHAVYGRKNDDVLWPSRWFASDQAPFEGSNEHQPENNGDNSEGVGVW